VNYIAIKFKECYLNYQDSGNSEKSPQVLQVLY
jgi:hypothetical protein